MKNPGHKRSISGHSQPTQSKYSQNSLLNTMIRVNKIGGVASNLDSSALNNGTRPSISPYRKNSNSREATPKTAISRNSAQTTKSQYDNISGLNRNKMNSSLNNNYSNSNSNTNIAYKYNSGNKAGSKTPPPMQPKRIQSTNNFVINRNSGLLNSVTGLTGSQRGNFNLMNSSIKNFKNDFESSTRLNRNGFDKSLNNNHYNNSIHSNNKDRLISNNAINPLHSSMSSSRNFFSKINNKSLVNKNINHLTKNITSSKQIQTNHRNILRGMESSLNASTHRINRASNNINSNRLKNGTKIVINNDNLTQRKFENNLKTGKNWTNQANAVNDHSNYQLNNSIEKSSTNSFNNSNCDKIKVNKSNLLLHEHKGKLNSNNTNNTNVNSNNNSSNNITNNNNSYNNSNNEVLSSLINSKNYSKSPKRKTPSPGLQKSGNIFNDINKSSNSLNTFGKPGLLNGSLGGSNNININGNDLFTKIYSMNAQSRKNFETSQKQNREKSKTPSPGPISSSLNNLNILNNLKINKNMISKNAKNLNNINNNNLNNNFSLKKLSVLNNANSNSQTIQINKIKNNLNGNKNNQVKGTIIEMNADEFVNKSTGKFGGKTKESFYNINNENTVNKNNSNNNSQYNSNNNFKKDEIKNNNSFNNHIGMSFGNFKENNINVNNSNNGSVNVFNYNGNNPSRENKLINSISNDSYNQNNGSKPSSSQGTNNKLEDIKDNLSKELLNNLNMRQMEASNLKINSFKDMNTSPFLKVNKKIFFNKYL